MQQRHPWQLFISVLYRERKLRQFAYLPECQSGCMLDQLVDVPSELWSQFGLHGVEFGGDVQRLLSRYLQRRNLLLNRRLRFERHLQQWQTWHLSGHVHNER